MPARWLALTILLVAIHVVPANSAPAETGDAAPWPSSITCPAATFYHAVRQDAGLIESCEREFPGSLFVQDGPSRGWFNRTEVVDEGDYDLGQEKGRWKECDRFGRCKHTDYTKAYGFEKRRPEFKPEVPVTYVDGKYRVDFASCRSTWLIERKGGEGVVYNIGANGYHCDIARFAENEKQQQEDDYLCRVPFGVGVREFGSLDLRREFRRAGLPAFCAPQKINATGLNVFVQSGAEEIAYPTDMQCASLRTLPDGGAAFVMKFNPFITAVLREQLAHKKPLTARLCGSFSSMQGLKADAAKNDTFSLPLTAAYREANAHCLTERTNIPACD